ncbi:MAG: hypothetical protein ACYTAS_21020, partial [Planctomycetota bacterium]
MISRRIATVCLTVAIASALTHAQTTLYVDDDNCPGPGSGTEGDPYCLIQDAINAAIDGDEVLVAPGTYNEAIFFQGDPITVRGSGGPDVTIIDATGLSINVVRCFLGEGPDTVLQGFTLTGGDAERGGGMWNFNSSPTIRDCRFVGNNAALYAGGMYNQGSSPLVVGCTFEANTAIYGGG